MPASDSFRAELTLKAIAAAVISVGPDGRVNFMNDAAAALTGWAPHEALGRPAVEVVRLVSRNNSVPVRCPLEAILDTGVPDRLPSGTLLVRRDGQLAAIEDSSAPIRDASGALAGAVMVFHDVTSAQQLVLEMAHRASHDVLTDLPNRAMLEDRIAQAVAHGERHNAPFALLYLDLDRFKHINDTLGHAVGDRLLCSVADRLRACVRHSDTVCRQGGDEFLVLLADQQTQDHAAHTADKILTALSVPHEIDGYQLHVGASLGIALFPDDGRDAVTLIRNADTAMYRAKRSGRNNARFFKKEMNRRAVERQHIEADLRRALGRGEFCLHYQARVALGSGALTGAEALLRWNHPQWGMVEPDRFLAVAEGFGMMVPLGRWVLREACAQARRWQDAGILFDTIAVNISGPELRSHALADTVREALDSAGLAPACLELEIAEGALMHDSENSLRVLARLKELGVRVAIDDFGTGYSSLSCLRRMPIDTLKIDRSFVRTIGAGDRGDIASAAIAMGSSLKFRIVAQGVEDRCQLDFLKAHACDEGQGFYFGSTLGAAAFTRVLDSSARA